MHSLTNPNPPMADRSHHVHLLWALAVLLLAVLVIPAVISYSLSLRNQENSKPENLTTPLLISQATQPPSNDPKVNWKTYTNIKYNYTVKYPEFLSLLESPDQYSVNFSSIKPPVPVGENPWLIVIQALDNSKKLDAAEFIDQYILPQFPSDRLRELKREKIKISGIESEKIIGLPSMAGGINVYIPYGDKMIFFYLSPYSPEDYAPTFTEESTRTFDQILSTFRSLDDD